MRHRWLSIKTHDASISGLTEYARIPIAFESHAVMRVTPSGDAGFALTEAPVDPPIFKNYDALPGEGPLGWASRFDLSKWTLFMAWMNEVHVGGAALVFQAPEIELLEGRDDVGLLWDIRVDPSRRGCGIGSALLEVVEQTLIARGAHWLDVETQQINAGACRFYSRNGFHLRRVNSQAYPECPDEIQLLWRKWLPRARV